MPAFVVPFMFVLVPEGVGLLLKTPVGGHWGQVLWIGVAACIGIGALAAGLQGWLLRHCNVIERVLLIVAGLALTYPNIHSNEIGLGLLAVAIALHVFR